jgi:MFS family permease
LFENPQIKNTTRKRTIAIGLLFASTLAWFYIVNSFLRKISNGLDPNLYYIGILLLAISIVASGILGSIVSERLNRRKFLAIWICFGLFTSFSIAVFSGFTFFLILCVMIGVSFGLGFPACQAFLTESVNVEKRGRATGVTFGFTFILVVFILSAVGSLNVGLFEFVITLVLLKSIGFIAIFIDPCERETGPIAKWSSILKSREFLLYGSAWMIFQLANGITIWGNFSQAFKSVQEISEVLQLLAIISAAFLGGFLADRFGRKQPMIIGLLGLGLSYAFLGLMSHEAIVYLTYMTVEGFALGMIFVVYLQVILGDISAKSGSKERFYALGGLIIPFSMAAIFESTQQWYSITVPVNLLTAILSVVILLSVIPVLRAVETLPQQKIQERKLQEHIRKVEKIVKESKEN